MSTQGIEIKGKQGAALDAETKAFEITVAGTVHKRIGTLATAAGVILYQANATTVDTVTGDDFPATFDYGFFWCDQLVQLQLITDTPDGSVVFDVPALEPFVIPEGTMLITATDARLAAAAATTPIDMIFLRNDSGNTANYMLVLID